MQLAVGTLELRVPFAMQIRSVRIACYLCVLHCPLFHVANTVVYVVPAFYFAGHKSLTFPTILYGNSHDAVPVPAFFFDSVINLREYHNKKLASSPKILRLPSCSGIFSNVTGKKQEVHLSGKLVS